MYLTYAHHASHSHLGTYFAHLIIRGFVYRVMFHLPFMVAIIVAAVAVYWLFGRKGSRR